MTPAEGWQWINNNLTIIAVLGPLAIAIVGGLWKAFTYFHKGRKSPPPSPPAPTAPLAPITQTHSGHGDNVGGDKIVHTCDPQDRVTIANLNAALELYQAQLEAKNITQRELEQQINELRGALQLAQSSVRGGGALASAAQTLMDTFISAPDDQSCRGNLTP